MSARVVFVYDTFSQATAFEAAGAHAPTERRREAGSSKSYVSPWLR
jgi:hypothetical protein